MKYIFSLAVMIICIKVNGQTNKFTVSDDKLVIYSLDKFWNEKSVASSWEDFYKLKMVEVVNNYSKKQLLFIQIHALCIDTNFIANIYSISYRDQDHLGKLRLFIGENNILNPYAIERNKMNITESIKIHESFPNKFNPIEGLNVISQYGLVGTNKCK
jgi:hypothetical protein